MALQVDEAWVRRYCLRHGFKDPLEAAPGSRREQKPSPTMAEGKTRKPANSDKQAAAKADSAPVKPVAHGSQRLVIFGRMMGLNEYTELNRANAYMGNKFKQAEQQPIKIAIQQAHLKPVKRPVRLRYLWVEPDRRRDHDNVAFAQKFVQDALVICGILPDDGWDWVTGFEHAFDVDAANPRIEIEILEV